MRIIVCAPSLVTEVVVGYEAEVVVGAIAGVEFGVGVGIGVMPGV